MYHYKLALTKKPARPFTMTVCQCDFHDGSVVLSKIMDFLKNPGLPKEELNKIGFIYYYKIVHTKKPLGHLRLQLVSATFILRVNFFENPGPSKERLNKISFIHYYEIVHTKKSAELFMMMVCQCNFHSRIQIFQKS